MLYFADRLSFGQFGNTSGAAHIDQLFEIGVYAALSDDISRTVYVYLHNFGVVFGIDGNDTCAVNDDDARAGRNIEKSGQRLLVA